MKKGGKNADVAPPPPPPPVDPTPQDLLNLFAQERGKKRQDLVEFTHAKYNDWLRYFGFSMDKELEWNRQHKSLLDGERSRGHRRATISMHRVQSPPHKPGVSLPSLAPAAGKKEGINDQCPFLSNLAVASACWELPPKLDEVDAFALGLGPLPQATTAKAVVEACTKPYHQVTWRLSLYACTHYKIRAIYRWLCHNIRVTPPQPKAASGPSVTIQEPAAAAAAPKKAAAASGKKGAPEAASPVPVATNPEDAVIQAKTADPLGVALLFARMCEEAGIEVDVVKGTLKGVLDGLGKPHGFVPWAWNVVKANDAEGTPRQYLVDVALSSMHMTPFDGQPSKRAQTPGAGPGSPAGGAAQTSTTGALTSPTPSGATGAKFVDLASGAKVFEPFYFYTKPQSFGPLHFPEDHSKLLLQNLVTKTQWEVSPRLSHEFFALGLTLDSHKRRCTFTTKSTPVYLSVLVDPLATTDLICRVFKGHMAGIDPIASEPIEPKFVWQQREEAERRVTFSIMMPDVGHYTIAIGGRSNPKQCGAALPSGAYFPTVLVYQALVNFVSVNEPMFPHQHISPTVAKLMEPLRHKILGGQQRFAVAPCVPNVFAVGIVNRIFKPPSAAPPRAVELPAAPSTPTPRTGGAKKAAGAKAGAAPPAPAAADVAALKVVAAPEIDRVHMELLPLNPKTALFEGSVDLCVGLVEVWLFFGDPTSLSVASGGNDKPTTAASIASEGGDAGGAAATAVGSPNAASAPPVPAPPPPPANAKSTLKAVGKFHPLTTDIQVVKRVPAKELALNEGRSLIQPLPQMDTDRSVILQMLTDAGDPVPHPRPTDDSGQPRVIGTYFDKKRQPV